MCDPFINKKTLLLESQKKKFLLQFFYSNFYDVIISKKKNKIRIYNGFVYPVCVFVLCVCTRHAKNLKIRSIFLFNIFDYLIKFI